jgi:GNAT superfamily N-acetyltransferase
MRITNSDKVDRATRADIPKLVELKLAMFAESGRAQLLPEQKRDLVARDYESMYQEELAAHFLVKREGAIVACAGAFLKSDLPYRYFSPAFYGFLGDVYTIPAARGAGLARLLSEAAIAWLKSRGVLTVRLLASEAALPIYTSMGFKPTDEMVLLLPKEDE